MSDPIVGWLDKQQSTLYHFNQQTTRHAHGAYHQFADQIGGLALGSCRIQSPLLAYVRSASPSASHAVTFIPPTAIPLQFPLVDTPNVNLSLRSVLSPTSNISSALQQCVDAMTAVLSYNDTDTTDMSHMSIGLSRRSGHFGLMAKLPPEWTSHQHVYLASQTTIALQDGRDAMDLVNQTVHVHVIPSYGTGLFSAALARYSYNNGGRISASYTHRVTKPAAVVPPSSKKPIVVSVSVPADSALASSVGTIIQYVNDSTQFIVNKIHATLPQGNVKTTTVTTTATPLPSDSAPSSPSYVSSFFSWLNSVPIFVSGAVSTDTGLLQQRLDPNTQRQSFRLSDDDVIASSARSSLSTLSRLLIRDLTASIALTATPMPILTVHAESVLSPSTIGGHLTLAYTPRTRAPVKPALAPSKLLTPAASTALPPTGPTSDNRWRFDVNNGQVSAAVASGAASSPLRAASVADVVALEEQNNIAKLYVSGSVESDRSSGALNTFVSLGIMTHH